MFLRAKEKTTNRSNLLLLTFDQWREDFSNPDKTNIRLPNIKNLRNIGLSINRCYTSSPQCVPARLSWITGLYPSQLGVTRNCAAELPSYAPSLIRELKEKGWHTEIIGKTHWTNHRDAYDLRKNKELLEDLGFIKSIEVAGPRALERIKCELTDEWEKQRVYDIQIQDLRERYGNGRSKQAWEVRPTVLPNSLYPDIWIADKAKKAIIDMPQDKPWLLWVSFVGPHDPYDTPEKWKQQQEGTLPRAEKRARWIAS